MKWRPEFIPSPDPCELQIFSLRRARRSLTYSLVGSDGNYTITNYFRSKQLGQQTNNISVQLTWYDAGNSPTTQPGLTRSVTLVVRQYNDTRTQVIATETYQAPQSRALGFFTSGCGGCPPEWCTTNGAINGWDSLKQQVNNNSQLIEIVSDAQGSADACIAVYSNESFLSGGDGPPLDVSTIRTGPFSASVLIQDKEKPDGTLERYANVVYSYDGDQGIWVES